MIWPLKNPVITQEFGANPGSYDQFGYPGHNGLDLWTAESPPYVFSISDGQVEKVGWEAAGYGKYVVVLHDLYHAYYAHLDSVVVRPGQVLAAGSTIGLMGSTGFSTAPHLHLGIRLSIYKSISV